MRKVPSREIQSRVLETAAMLGLEPLMKRYPMQLSGGERQRVALGRAIVRDPSVFLLDEPLSNLDAQLRGEMRLGLAKIQRRLGATFVFVTHDQVEAMTLADVLAVMRAGVLQQVGPPDEIYARPANTFVAGFIGSPGMNLLEGDVEGQGLRIGETLVPLPLAPPRSTGRLIVGVRPEHARLDPDGALDLRVEVIEALGAQKFVYGTLGPEVPLTVGIDPALHPREGERLRLSLQPGGVHFFDPESGARL
jgi:sn-glycerol 3-phosphate transport system ATP-binding protein